MKLNSNTKITASTINTVVLAISFALTPIEVTYFYDDFKYIFQGKYSYVLFGICCFTLTYLLHIIPAKVLWHKIYTKVRDFYFNKYKYFSLVQVKYDLNRGKTVYFEVTLPLSPYIRSKSSRGHIKLNSDKGLDFTFFGQGYSPIDFIKVPPTMTDSYLNSLASLSDSYTTTFLREDVKDNIFR